MAIPIPVACQLDADTLSVQSFSGTVGMPIGGYELVASYDNGVTFTGTSHFFTNADGRDVVFEPTSTPYVLAYAREEGVISIYAKPQPETPPAGHHYEYVFSGDVASGSVSGNSAGFTPGDEVSRTINVTANLVRDIDDEVICTASDSFTQIVHIYQDTGPFSDPILACDYVPPPVVLEVTLSSNTGCPDDTITATGSHNITGATILIDSVAVPLTLTPGTTVSFEIPDTITLAGVYPITFTTDAEIDTVTDVVNFTVSAECANLPCTPPAPVACFDSLTTLKLSSVLAANFPVCTETLTLQTKVGAGSWSDAQTGIEADAPYSIALSAAAGMKARYKSDDDTTGPEIDLDVCECEPGGTPGQTEEPVVPAPPTLSKNCGNGTITVTSPAFVTTGNAQTASIEIRRRALPDGEWEDVHTFESAGWADDDAAELQSYEYSARACNAAGCSEWSTPANISLISTTTLSIVSPAPGTLSGARRVRMTRSASVTNPRLFWNGVQIGIPSLKDGFYIYDWSTLDSSQGEGVLRFQATGADGCEAFAEIEYTLDNSAAQLTSAATVICREGVAPAGQRIKSASFRYEARPLPPVARLRYFMRAAAYLDDLGATDGFDLEFDEETWAQGQPLLLERSRVLSDGTTQWTWYDLLAKKGATIGKRAIFRLRWDVGEVLLGYSTYGAESDSRIVKFRDDGENDDYHVLLLSKKDDDSAARIYEFDGSSATLLYELGDYDAPGAFDFALAGDKLFIASESELFYIDTDSGEASGDLKPRGENREIAFLESIGSTLFAVFVGAEDSKCYRWNGSWKEVWTLDEVVTKTAIYSDGLLLASTEKLYSSSGASAPALAQTFTSDISAIHERFIGLADGKLYELVNGEWVTRADRSGAITAASEYSGVTHETEDPRGIAGENSTALLEATINPAAWDDGRVLAAPALMDETVSGVSALHRFLKEVTAATGDPAQPGYKPAVYQEMLMIGTAPDGLLLTIEASEIAKNPLAVEATRAGFIHAAPIHEDIPEVPVED